MLTATHNNLGFIFYRLWENNAVELFVGPDQVGLGVHTPESRTSEQAVQTAHLLRVAAGHLLSRPNPKANARSTYYMYTNVITISIGAFTQKRENAAYSRNNSSIIN